MPLRWFVASLVLTSACSFDEPPGAPVPQELVGSVRLLGLDARLPASATDVWAHEASFLDAYQMLRFDAPLTDARAFARSLLGRDTVRGENPRIQAFGQDFPWWIHNYPDGAEGGSISEGRTTVKIILVPRGSQACVWMLLLLS